MLGLDSILPSSTPFLHRSRLDVRGSELTLSCVTVWIEDCDSLRSLSLRRLSWEYTDPLPPLDDPDAIDAGPRRACRSARSCIWLIFSALRMIEGVSARNGSLKGFPELEAVRVVECVASEADRLSSCALLREPVYSLGASVDAIIDWEACEPCVCRCHRLSFKAL